MTLFDPAAIYAAASQLYYPEDHIEFDLENLP
jgi:hypothetical protein